MYRIWCRYPNAPAWHWWQDYTFAIGQPVAEAIAQVVRTTWGGEAIVVPADTKHLPG